MPALADLLFVALVCLTTSTAAGHIARPRRSRGNHNSASATPTTPPTSPERGTNDPR
jgi:hypothetical protein